MVYISLKEEEFPLINNPTIELEGNDNIVSFDDISDKIISGVEYKWRVDCVEGITKKRRQGDIWVFKMNS